MSSVSVDGVELFYRQAGSGPPILLIHGFGGSADVWEAPFELLAEEHRVIAYDRRGFSRSVHAPVRSIERHGDDAAGLLRALDAVPATVVGWSNGAIVALDLAVHHPGLVAALVLEEPPLHLGRRPGFRQLRAVFTALLLARIKDEAAGCEAFLRWASRYSSGGNGYDRLPDSMRQQMRENGPASMAELFSGGGDHLSKEQVAAIACPVLCTAGELSDRAFTRAVDYVVDLLPMAEVKRIAGAGHAMHLERPAEFADAVSGWVHETAT